MLAPKDIATDLNTSLKTAYLIIKEMPYTRINRLIRVDERDYEEWKRKRRVG